MIDTLLFNGGGSLGISYIGVIKALEKLKILKNINTLCGTSIGSVFALMIVLNYNSSEMIHILKGFDIKKAFSLKMTNFLKHGVYGNDKYVNRAIKALLSVKYSEDITFEELYKVTKKHLIVNTTCLCDNEPIYFDHINTPNAKVWKAVRMSISIPYIFPAVKYQGKFYVDGGVCPMPINKFDQDKTLVFGFAGYRVLPKGNFYVLKQLLNTISRLHEYHSKYVVMIEMKKSPVSVPDEDTILEMIRLGYVKTLEYVKENGLIINNKL